MKTIINLGVMAILFAGIATLSGCSPEKKIALSTNTLQFGSDSDLTDVVKVTSNGNSWDAQIEPSATDWLSIELSNTAIEITATVNKSGSARTGIILVFTKNNSFTQQITVTQAASTAEYQQKFTDGYNLYYGDLARNGTGAHNMVFANGAESFIDPMNGYNITDGIQMAVCFISEYYKSFSGFKIAAGKYTVSSQLTPNSILPGGVAQGSQIQYIKDGKLTAIKYITNGYSEISYSQNKYIFTFNFILDDDTSFTGRFEGDMDTYGPTLSYLHVDYDLKGLTHGVQLSYGQEYITGLNDINMILLPQDIDFDAESGLDGTGEMLSCEILTALSNDTIPAGEYPITFDDKANTTIAGFVKTDTPNGCFIFNVRNGNIDRLIPILSGNVSVGKTNDIYTIKLNGIDDRGNKVTAEYKGSMPLQGYSAEYGYTPSVKIDHQALNALNIENTCDTQPIGNMILADR